RHPFATAQPDRGEVAAPGGPCVQEPAGQPEADGEHQQWRQRPVGDGDRDVRRSPHEVDGAESDGDLRPHASMVPSGVDQDKLSYRSYRLWKLINGWASNCAISRLSKPSPARDRSAARRASSGTPNRP